VIVELPATGERITAQIVDCEPYEPLAVTFGFLGHVHYMLGPMLETGWRIVDATPEEQAALQSHGLSTDPRC